MNATIPMESIWQMALLSAFKQAKALKEGKLKTRPIDELFKELENER